MQATSISYIVSSYLQLNSNTIGRVIYTHTTHAHTRVYNNDITQSYVTQHNNDTCLSYSSCCCTGSYATFSFSLML